MFVISELQFESLIYSFNILAIPLKTKRKVNKKKYYKNCPNQFHSICVNFSWNFLLFFLLFIRYNNIIYEPICIQVLDKQKKWERIKSVQTFHYHRYSFYVCWIHTRKNKEECIINEIKFCIYSVSRQTFLLRILSEYIKRTIVIDLSWKCLFRKKNISIYCTKCIGFYIPLIKIRIYNLPLFMINFICRQTRLKCNMCKKAGEVSTKVKKLKTNKKINKCQRSLWFVVFVVPLY